MNDSTADAYVDADADAGTSALKVLALVVVVCIILLCVTGNVLVILAIVLNRRVRKRRNWLYVSLAVADLLVGTCVVTFALANDMLGRWLFGEAFCHVWISLDVMCSTASIVNLSAIAFDRYMHVRSPFTYARHMSRVRMLLIIVAVWILSVGISFIPIKMGWHCEEHPDDAPNRTDAFAFEPEPVPVPAEAPQCKFSVNATYAIASSCISFFTPSICLVLVYGRLHRIARSHYAAIQQTTVVMSVKRRHSAHTPERHTPLRSNAEDACSNTNLCQPKASLTKADWGATGSAHGKFFQERKATITLGFLIGVFLFCWSPFFTCNILAPLCKSCISDFLFALVTYLGYSNSALNPITIFLTNGEFRKSLRKLVKSLKFQQQEQLLQRHQRQLSAGIRRTDSKNAT